MNKNKNQFTDSFKYLTSAKNNILDLKKNINYALNKILPSRILSKANIFNMTIDVSQDIANLVLLNVEDSLVENNILIAQKMLSVRGLATLNGHNANRAISSNGVLKVNFKSMAYQNTPSIIFNNVIFKCENNNMFYFNNNPTTITNKISGLFNVTEGEWVKNELVSNGDSLETFSLDNNSPIENNLINVKINGELYNKYDSIYDMKANTKGFIVKNGIGSQIDVMFGDGINGNKLNEGDKVEINYVVTNGEYGNISELNNAKFKIVSGVYDTNGNELDINDDIYITALNGFKLGSNGEDIERTRAISGYNSRAMVFTRPENLKAYLTRLSIISYVDVWSDLDSNIYNILILPNIKNKLKEYRDYLTLSESEFTLDTDTKNSIIDYINGSGGQNTTTELLLREPTFKKYAVFVYVKGNIIEKDIFKQNVENNISEVFLNKTFLNINIDNIETITKNEIIESILNINGVNECNVSVFSEENEIAIINGEYFIEETIFNGATKTKKKVRKIINKQNNNDEYDLHLGFNELGGIENISKLDIPILKGGFKLRNLENPIDKPIYIFYKQNGDYESL